VADSRKLDRHVKCPRCNYRYHYRCADGRRKCKRCGKLFTHSLRGPRNRLGRDRLDEIARLFWLGVPAVRAAKDLGLHRNTTYRHYKRLRERIAADREAQLSKLHGHIEADESYFGGLRKGKRGRGAAGKIPVFGLLKCGGEGDIDEDPPEVTDVKASPNPTFGADVVSLTCKADDAEHGGSFIAGGEYFVNDAEQDGEGMPLTAGDGDFDDSYEELLALIDVSGCADGSTHILYVHARDAAGNWSPLQSVVVETEGDFFDPSRAYVWPNPANDAAHFAFTVGGDARVELVVYDLAGREVHRERGEFVVGTPGAFVWNLDGVASDVFIFRLAAEEIGGMGRSGSVMKKLAVVR